MVFRDLNLAFGDRGRRDVEHQRRAVETRRARGDRVRRKTTVRSAMRGHQNAEAGGVDEMDGGKSGLRHLLRPCTDATEMSRIADRGRAKAGLPRLGDREVHGFAADDLSIAELPIDNDITWRFADDSCMLVGDHHAFGVPVDVLGYANDAVRFVSGQIGVDEMITDDPRFAFCRSGRADHRADEHAQVGDRYAVSGRTGAHRPEYGVRSAESATTTEDRKGASSKQK